MNSTTTNAADVAINLAHLTDELGKAREIVDDVIEQGKHKAERLGKQATWAVEDCLEDTRYYIKKHPWQAVGVASCLGLAAGLLVSLALNPIRDRKK